MSREPVQRVHCLWQSVMKRRDGIKIAMKLDRKSENRRSLVGDAAIVADETVSLEIAEDALLDALRESESRLAAELAGARQLQDISTKLIEQDDAESLYQAILDAAVAIMRSDMGSMQMFHPDRNELFLLASKGFSSESVKFWTWVRVGGASTCSIALKTGQQCIAPDVETCDFMAGTADLDAYRQANIRALQSTPLVSRNGQVVGMISTHWSQPHQPSEAELRLLDVLARQAADLIERKQAEERQALLVKELNHRVKNTLAIVQALAQQTFRAPEVPKLARKAFEGRLEALASAHDLLTREQWESADLAGVVDDALNACGVRDRVEVEGPTLRLGPTTAVTLELARWSVAVPNAHPFRARPSEPRPSEPRRLRHGAVARHVAGVQRARRLEQNDLDLRVRYRSVLDATRHDEEVARLELDMAIAELHAELAAMHEEHLIFVIVMMPHELADELHELDVLAVELTDDLRGPVLRERGELRC